MSENKNQTPILKKQALSICMIVKNEALILARCLLSCRNIADEIIIVDTGSTDNTIGIARSFGAQVITSIWENDFSKSRNISLQNAACDWILWLDGDDVVPAESISPINALKKEKPHAVFGFTVRNQKPGGTGTEFVQARMFPNDRRIRFERRIHEQMMLSALRIGLKLVPKPVVIEHQGYADPAALNQKAKRNVALLLEEYQQSGPDPILAVEIADSYLILGNDTEASQWYTVVLESAQCESIFPHIAAQAYLGKGNILNKIKAFSKAEELFRKALKLTPNRPDTLFSLAISLDLQERKEEALECLKKIITMSSQPLAVGVDFREAKIKSFLRIERLLYDLNKIAESVVVANQALVEFAHRPEIQNMAGRVYFKNNKILEALHFYEKSLQLDTLHNVDAYIGLCKIYLKAGKHETAHQTMKENRELFERSPRYWAFYKILYSELPKEVVPVLVTEEDIEKEIGYLNKVYS